MKRLIALFLATVQFRSIAAIGYARPAYNPYTGAGAPPPPALTPAQRAAQRDPNLLAARPLQRSAAPKPTHALYMQINLGQSAEDVPTADYNGIEGLQLMNASAAADLFTLAGVYGTTAAQHLSAPSRYTIKPSVPRGSEAEKYLAGLPVIQADSAGRYLVPGERERERAPVVPSDNLAVRAYYLGSCCRRSRRRYVLVSQVPPLPPSLTSTIPSLLACRNNTDGGEHPIHLHGHPFYVVATDANPRGTEQRYAPYFLRRDVVSINAEGWAKTIFVADYTSIIMVHCHIGECGEGFTGLHSPRHPPTPLPPSSSDWHMRAGLIAELVIAPEKVLGMPIPASDVAVCKETLGPHGHGYQAGAHLRSA